MKLQIEDKRKFTLSVAVFIFMILILGGFVYYFLAPEKVDVSEQKTAMTKEGNGNADALKSGVGKDKEIVFLEYKNQKYGYLVRYPDTWHISSEEAESDLAVPDVESGIDYPLGGQIFWSNYANINDYTPQNKPDDFRLLGLTIYQGSSETVDDFAQKIGISEDAARVEFETESKLAGSQFIFSGLTKNDLKITVVLKKDKLFYVFKTAFINGDEQAAGIMENIIKSFDFQSH